MELQMDINQFLPLRDVVFQTLRQEILRGCLKPGERLMEMQLAGKLGVSRTPVREAIRKLELEGLVIVLPRRGAIVAEISEKSLRDVLEIRKALEILAVGLVCERMEEKELVRLKEAAVQFEKVLLAQEDITVISQADIEFHDSIYEVTNNEKLLQLLNQLREQMYRYRAEYLKQQDFHLQLLKEHQELIQMIEKRDKTGAARVIGEHIDHQISALREILRKN